MSKSIPNLLFTMVALWISIEAMAQTIPPNRWMIQVSHGYTLLSQSRFLQNEFEKQGYLDISDVPGFESEAKSHHAYDPLYRAMPFTLSILFQAKPRTLFALKAGLASTTNLDHAKDINNEINFGYSNIYFSPILQWEFLPKPKIYTKVGPVLNLHRTSYQMWSEFNGYSTGLENKTTIGLTAGLSAVLKTTYKLVWTLDIDCLVGSRLKVTKLPVELSPFKVWNTVINVGNSFRFYLPRKRIKI